MVESRLFQKGILQSSLYYQLGEQHPGKELHAQRLWETLILLADDYGRGRFIPADLRMRAFTAAPSAFAEISLDDIGKFMDTIEYSGSAYRYEVNNEIYFFIPKWFIYQPVKYRCKSHIPPPPETLLSKLNINLSDIQENLQNHSENSPPQEKKEGESEKTPIRREEKRIEKKRKEINIAEISDSENSIPEKPIEKKQYLDNIFLTDDELKKLKIKYGDDFQHALEIYDAWKSNSKKKIKSDYKSMLATWIQENLNKLEKSKSFHPLQYGDYR